MSLKVRMIDPPEGRDYGFPKPCPSFKTKNDFRKWMVQSGYPQQLIDQGLLDYCKFFTVELPLDEDTKSGPFE